MIVEATLFAISMAAILSSLDFISKSMSNLTHSLGIPEYLASSVILSFTISIPSFLILLFSNLFDFASLGISVLIGFSLVNITLIMGVFLFKNELPIEYEGYRNSTFMWAAALLFLITSIDQFIDRVDALFMLALFIFYVIYIYYRTGKAKEYVYLKRKTTHMILFPAAVAAIIICSYLASGTIFTLSQIFDFSLIIFGLAVFNLLLSVPVLDVIINTFKSGRLTFDNLLGNVVVNMAFIPGIIALVKPIGFSMSYPLNLVPILMLNIVCLSFAVITRTFRAIHKKTGIILIFGYIAFVIYLASTLF